MIGLNHLFLRETFGKILKITLYFNCSVTEQGLMFLQCRYLQQSQGLFAGHQARRMGSSCSKDLNSPMAFKQGFLKTVLGEGGYKMHVQLIDLLLISWL